MHGQLSNMPLNFVLTQNRHLFVYNYLDWDAVRSCVLVGADTMTRAQGTVGVLLSARQIPESGPRSDRTFLFLDESSNFANISPKHLKFVSLSFFKV